MVKIYYWKWWKLWLKYYSLRYQHRKKYYNFLSLRHVQFHKYAAGTPCDSRMFIVFNIRNKMSNTRGRLTLNGSVLIERIRNYSTIFSGEKWSRCKRRNGSRYFFSRDQSTWLHLWITLKDTNHFYDLKLRHLECFFLVPSESDLSQAHDNLASYNNFTHKQIRVDTSLSRRLTQVDVGQCKDWTFMYYNFKTAHHVSLLK